MRPSTRIDPAWPNQCSLRTSRLLGIGLLLAVLIATGCGKKGPPLAPFARVPAAVGGITAQRIGGDVYLSFTVPDTNADGRKPADIGEVRVYAVTSDRPPQTEKQRDVATLIATLPVRPIMPAPANESPDAPVIPLPPGVDRGATAVVREELSAEVSVPVELPIDKHAPIPPPAIKDGEEPFGPLVAPPPTRLPSRHYFAIAVSPKGRKSTPSPVASIPLEPGSSAPGAPTITHDAVSMTITWTPPADARGASFLLPPTPKPAAAGANATPANVTPRAPTPLTAKSLGFVSEPTTYQVYDVTPAPIAPATNTTPVAPDPYAIKVPAAITPAAIADTEFVIKGVTFGVERCFDVRAVDRLFGATIVGPPSPRTCITAMDTFPPAAPKSLAAIAAPGVINLIWEANTDSDLGGYIVLRGEAPGDTLQPITKEPLAANAYRDETVRPGTRYVYAVIAVDRANPPNESPQSNRVEETARQ